MEWTLVGSPGNACDPQPQGCFGSVDYGYVIGTYEITNAQYAEFLNAKATSDPLALYNPSLGVVNGIIRSGAPGSYSYSAVAGRDDMPVGAVSFFDAARFANWLHNGQGAGDTETGAYTLLGGTATPSNWETVVRNEGAVVFLASEDEWYKAAYYDPEHDRYFDYPTASDTPTVCSTPTSSPNRANCNLVPGDLTNVGSYTGSAIHPARSTRLETSGNGTNRSWKVASGAGPAEERWAAMSVFSWRRHASPARRRSRLPPSAFA